MWWYILIGLCGLGAGLCIAALVHLSYKDRLRKAQANLMVTQDSAWLLIDTVSDLREDLLLSQKIIEKRYHIKKGRL